MTEHQVQMQIVEYLRVSGWLTICCDVMSALGYILGNKRFQFINHYKSMGYTKGQVDLIAIKKGVVVFIEVKAKSGVISDEQEEFAETLNKNGMFYILAKNINDVMDYTGGII